MWKDLLDEQDDIFYPKLRSPIQSANGSDPVARAREIREPRPGLARLSSWAEDLEEMVVTPGFRLQQDGRIPSPAYASPEQMKPTLASGHIRVSLPHQAPKSQRLARAEDRASYGKITGWMTHEQTREGYDDIYRQIDDEKPGTEPRPATQPDLDHASPLVAASDHPTAHPPERLSHPQEARREPGVCYSGGGNIQDPVACGHRVPLENCAFRIASAEKQGEECVLKRVIGLKNAEGATRVKKSPGAEKTKSPSASFCKDDRKRKKTWQKRPKVEDHGSTAVAAKDVAALGLALASAEYVLTTEEARVVQEWRLGLKTAKESVFVTDDPLPGMGHGSEPGACGAPDFHAGQNRDPKTIQFICQTPASAKQVATNKAHITESTAARDLLPSHTDDERAIAGKMLYNGMQELCGRFSTYDRLAGELEDFGGGREELNAMTKVLKQTDSRMKDVAYFAEEHQLSDIKTYNETIQDMVDALAARQKSLWNFGVKLWNVSQYSEGYVCALNEQTARVSEKADEDEKVCTKHCWWHSSAACMDKDDVFQDRSVEN
jgi:hypothetical protein